MLAPILASSNGGTARSGPIARQAAGPRSVSPGQSAASPHRLDFDAESEPEFNAVAEGVLHWWNITAGWYDDLIVPASATESERVSVLSATLGWP
jgi:hypothetical protein